MAQNKKSISNRKYNFHHKVFFWSLNSVVPKKSDNSDYEDKKKVRHL